MNPLRRAYLVSCSAVALACAASVHAAPLYFDHVSALDGARQIGDQYGVNIVFKGDFGPAKYVTFTLPDADASGARLQAVNLLANAVGADFTKTYVVSKLGADQDVPVARVDTNAPIVFPSVTMSVQQAISAVAAVDSATAQFPGEVSGNVTLSSTRLSASSAAQEIAAQTHTRWKVFYALIPRTNGRQTGGKVIDRTNGGSPITELPYVYYQHIPTPAERQADAQTGDNGQSGMSDPMNGYPSYGDPYGNNGYDYGNPYGYGDNGFGNGGYIDGGSGLIIGTGNSYGGGYGDGPIIFQRFGY